MRFPTLGTTAALFGFLVAAAIGGLSLLVSHVLLHTVPAALAVGCGLYLLAIHTGPRRNSRAETAMLGPVLTRLLPSLVLLGTTALLALALIAGGRGPLFYAVAAAVGTLLFAQIVWTPRRDLWPGLILAEILALAAVVRLVALVMTPSLIGVDVWIHAGEYIPELLATRSIGETATFSESKYATAPLYHLLVVATALLLDASPQVALVLSIGIALPLSIAVVYPIGQRLAEARWGLFATALFSFSDFAILWGIHLIPTSLALVFFACIVALLVDQLGKRHPRHGRRRITAAGALDEDGMQHATPLLVAFFTVAIVLTHQVSAFILLTFLGAAATTQAALGTLPRSTNWFRRRLARKERVVPAVTSVYGYLIFAGGVTVFLWSQTQWRGQTFTERVIEILFGSLAGAGPSSRTDATDATPESTGLIDLLIPYLDYLGFVLLIIPVTIAGLYAIQHWRNEQRFMTIVIATGIMLVFTLVPPLFGLRNLLPGRWFAFVAIPLSLLAAMGFAAIRPAISPQVFGIVLLLVVLIFPGAMLISTDATPDRPAFDEHTPRYAYTTTELSGMDTVAAITALDGSASDSDTLVLISDSAFASNANTRTDSDHFRSGVVSSDPDEPAVVSAEQTSAWRVSRSHHSTGAPLWANAEDSGVHTRQVPLEGICRADGHLAYDNGDVRLCGPSAQ